MKRNISALVFALATGPIAGAESTNSASVTGANTNLAAASAAGTNSVPDNATISNAVVVSASTTNAVEISIASTNPVIDSAAITNVVVTRDALSSSRLDLPSFRIISERNIFDPHRSPHLTRTAPPTRREPERTERRTRTESFVLLGTMSYDKGSFAFFEGSSSQYQQVLKPADSIAGYKIAAITSTLVRLESTNGQAIEMPVGMQLKRQDEGEWTLSARAESLGSSPRASVSGDRPGGSISSGDASEALKRLMQKREQEGNPAISENSEAPVVPVVPVVSEEPVIKAEKLERTPPGPAGGADDILRKLMEKREQELNK